MKEGWVAFDAFAMSAIGSFPHVDAEAACDLILTYLDELPVWPQLPHRGFQENMYAQYGEGIPGAVLDMVVRKIWCDTGEGLLAEVESAYQDYLEGNTGAFAISRDRAEGLYVFAERLRDSAGKYPVVKGQVTGPISFGLTVGDENNRPILYNETLADAMVKVLAMKARWMEGFLKAAGAAEVVTFFDEPYLVSVGSALVSIDPEQVIGALNECAAAVSGPTGVHCCGNTDWSMLTRTNIDILNFDAYEFMENVALYPEDIQALLARGGRLAWGLVPNNEAYRKETAASLAERFEAGVDLLAGRGVDRALLLERCIITPSCGLDGVSVEDAKGVLRLMRELSGTLKERYA